MAKITPLNDIASLANTLTAKSALNINWQRIEDAFANTLSRDGSSPNQMQADIDLNSNDLLNVAAIDATEYLLNGVPLAQSVAYADKRYQIESGTGVRVDWPLSVDPGSLGNLEVSIAGVMQRPGLDYNYTGSTLTFTVAPPAGTDNILIRYDLALFTGVTTASAVTYLQDQFGSITRSIQSRLLERTSIFDLGARFNPLDATNAFQLAANAGGIYDVAEGAYDIGAIAAGNPVIWAGGRFTDASGTLPLALPGTIDGYFQNQKFIYQSQAGASDVNTMQVRRDVNYTGGTFGFLNKALSAFSVVNTTANTFEAAFFAEQDNYSSDGQNFCMGAQARKHGIGSSWALVTETHEMDGLADPSRGTIGYEANIFANGTDLVGNRNVIAIICKRKNPAGAVATIGHGISITCSSDDVGGVKYGSGLSLGRSLIPTDFDVGIDMRFATFTSFGIGVWLPTDAAIALSTDATYRISALSASNRIRLQPGGGGQLFDFMNSGTLEMTGNISILGNQVVTSRRTGWTAASGTATRTTFATGAVTLPVLAEHVKALIDDLLVHGLIGA